MGETAPAPQLPFRIHFESGEKLDITAADVAAARKHALEKCCGIIRKIKIIKEA